MNTAFSLPVERTSSGSRIPSIAVVLATLLVAAPWFWPILAGPLPAMLPDMFAWTCGALLIGLSPWIRKKFDLVLAWGLIIAACGSSVLAFIQYFDYEDSFGIWIASTPPGHAVANVHQTNMLATLLACGLWALWYLVKVHKLVPALAALFGAFVVTAMAATASRTGMVHLFLLCGVAIYWSPSRRKVAVLSSIALGVTYLLMAQLLPWLMDVLRGIQIDRDLIGRFSGDAGCASRWVVWDNVFHLIRLMPWLGWGTGELMYAQYITPFEGLRYCQKMSNAHNLFLHIAVTMGLPFAAFCFALTAAALLKTRPWLCVSPTQQFGWGVLLVIAFHSMVEYPVWFGVFQILVAMVILLIVADGGRLQAERNGEQVIDKGQRHWTVVSFAILVLLSLVFWDYLKVSQLYLPQQWRLAQYKEDTLNRTRDTILFKSHVLIAQVVTTPVTAANAEAVLAGGLEALRTAPDPRVIKQVIAAATMAGQNDLARLHSVRFEAAWPKDYAEWRTTKGEDGRLP